ncbi:DivIVA domain-containing protein [Citricoccus sp. NPDC079358]|jgi:DivIVA domain-containing protein|uniref:DivIVA domain-containing protein n=1 Tax=Citricoccus sp. NPDC079358 TaxID=3154653 RepID=UPI00344B51D8
MALTPEDVVNKRFQPTKFREGYDQDEVDDFLDEIVVELRRLNQENDELRRKVSDLQSGGSGESAVPAPVSAEAAEDQDAQVKAGSAPETVDSTDTTESAQVEDAPAVAPATAAPAAGAAVPAAAAEPIVSEPAPAAAATPVGGAPESTATSAAGVLAMAQKLHDDYVAEGQTKREEIILEAQTEANGLVNDAQEKSRKTLADLEEKKSVLERKVEQLKGFERDYRARLKAYIEGQLRDLQNQGPIQDEATASN